MRLCIWQPPAAIHPRPFKRVIVLALEMGLGAGKSKPKRLKLGVREIVISALMDQNGKYYQYHNTNTVEPKNPHF